MIITSDQDKAVMRGLRWKLKSRYTPSLGTLRRIWSELSRLTLSMSLFPLIVLGA